MNHSLNSTPGLTPNELHQNWLKVYPFFMVQALLGISIIVINSFVLLLFFLERKTIKTPHKYIISMVVHDALSGVLFIPLLYSRLDYSAFYNVTICFVFSSLGFFIGLNSLSTMLISSIDRYWAIAFPIHHKISRREKISNCKSRISSFDWWFLNFYCRYYFWIVVNFNLRRFTLIGICVRKWPDIGDKWPRVQI